MSSDSHDVRADFRNRKILAFFLFLIIGLLDIAICMQSVMLNSTQIEKQFTTYACTSSFRQNIITYTQDNYTENGISGDNIEEIITQDKAQELVETYAASQFKSKIGFTQDTVDSAVDELIEEIKADIVQQTETAGFDAEESQIDAVCDEISEYITSQLDIPGMTYIDSILNVGGIVSKVVLAVAVFFMLVFAAMLYFTGKRRYRSVRSIAVSFAAAGITDLAVCVMALVTFAVKSVDIYPDFIKQAFDGYVNTSIGAVAVCGGVMLLVSLVLEALSWKLKKNNR